MPASPALATASQDGLTVVDIDVRTPKRTSVGPDAEASATSGAGRTADSGGSPVTESSQGPAVDIAELYRRQEPSLRRRLVRLGRRDDAQDLTHDAFVKTLANRDRLDGSGNGAGAFLHTVAGNVLRDRWKRERRAVHGNVRLAAGEVGASPSADALVETRLEGELVRAALGRLDQEKRQVLNLRVVEGRSSEETARLTGKTPAAVRQIQHRALVTLRNELTALGWARAGSPARKQEERP
jgi:RNA polymerase sigma-70 factor (ECF subfamily)